MDPQTATVVIAGFSMVTSIVTVYFSYKASKNAKEAKTEAVAATQQSNANGAAIEASDVKQTKAIEVVRQDVNDKMQQFIELTKTSSHAEGVKDEFDRDKALDPAILPDVVKVELVEDSRTGTQKHANETRKGSIE